MPSKTPTTTHANTTKLMVMGLMLEFCPLWISRALHAVLP